MSTWDYSRPGDVEPLSDEDVMSRLRMLRNSRLSECDFRVLPDATGDVEAWKAYRQALRDLPTNTDDPRAAVWPTPPA